MRGFSRRFGLAIVIVEVEAALLDRVSKERCDRVFEQAFRSSHAEKIRVKIVATGIQVNRNQVQLLFMTLSGSGYF